MVYICCYSPISPQPEEQGHTVIQGLVDKMATDVANLSQLWAKRNAQLEQCKKAIEFEQQVPVVCHYCHHYH